MPDNKKINRTLRDEQLIGSDEQAHKAQIEAQLKGLHTSMPGIIVSFDSATQTASVQPALQRIFTERGAVNLPLCVDVPVAFPGGGDFFLTFPVAAGDECILIFSERAIDNWFAYGGTQQPSEYRLHDLSDAIAVVGLNSQAKKLTNLQMTGAELRNRSRSTFIRLEGSKIYINGDIEHTGNLNRTGDSNQTGLMTGQGGMNVSGGSGVSMTGSINHTGGTITSNGKNIGSNHTHNETGAITLGPNP